MSFLHFVKLLLRNLKWLLLVPLMIALSIYYFTRGEKKVFSSETVIYTGIASGYSLNGSNKADYFATSNAFDNLLSIINSRETKELVAIELLSTHLLQKKHDPQLLSWSSYDQLQKMIPDSLKAQLIKPSLQETIAGLNKYMQADDKNLIYNLLNSENPFYSIKSLQNIQAVRINSSDLIRISYETDDAAICKHTLEILVETFIKKHKLLREGQTDSVIAYFERQTSNSFRKLDSVEQAFLDFNRKNDIINYYEQTKAVAGEKENLYAQNHSLEMEREASGKALSKVNENLKGRLYQSLYGTEIMSEREKLSDAYNKIALSEIVAKEDKSPNQKRHLDSLRSIANSIENNLKASLDKLYIQSNTPNGIPTKSVLDEWLKTTLAFEESKARLSVMDKRKKEFTEEYKKFAPLGAILKKIEREINVSEQEYLELLHGLNQARLTQQNNELTSKLTIVDAPYLPLKANASKRKMLIAVGFVLGFILVLAVIIARALLNQTLLEPRRASRKIGLPVTGLFPLLNTKYAFRTNAEKRLVQLVLSRIGQKDENSLIGILSIQNAEGKTTLATIISEGLQKLKVPATLIQWTPELDLTKNMEGIVLLELPPLEDLPMLKGMLPELNHSFLIVRANRVWGKKDNDLLKIYREATGNTPIPVLNGVEIDFAEDYLGEVPKNRAGLRSMVKRFVKFEFGNRKKIK
jgi:uncharacterized protein involved in exopolysaccharide biosynthesis